MKEINVPHVEGSIGYHFRNQDLLRQAFTRSSFSQENGGENNEVLEFIGDKALDLAVVRHLIQRFGKSKDNSFECACNEGELTRVKSRIVGRHYLAQRIDELGFARYIIMGIGDQKNEVGNEASVKEDLFEAIIGAVTLDCNWDFSIIYTTVESMICFDDFFPDDTDDNYVRLIQEWEERVNHTLPLFWFRERCGSDPIMYKLTAAPTEHGVVFQDIPLNDNLYVFICDLKLLDRLPFFRGWGVSKSEARMNVCKLAYNYLLREKEIVPQGIRDEIDEPSKEFAINQLEILARRKYFPLPEYTFSLDYDKDGNPVWQCLCGIQGFESQHSETNSSKKDAKKEAALKMLLYVLDHFE